MCMQVLVSLCACGSQTINVGILLEKRVAERLCKKFEISMDNYKSTIYHKLIGSNNEYPYEIVELQLWAYKKGEIRHELIFTENELLTILKNSLKDLVKIILAILHYIITFLELVFHL